VPEYEEQIHHRLERRQPRSNLTIASAVWNLGAAVTYQTSSMILEFVRYYEQMLSSMAFEAERQTIRSADEIVADSEWTGARRRAQILDQADRVYVDMTTVKVQQRDQDNGQARTSEYEYAESGTST
jgi:transposase-like protein